MLLVTGSARLILSAAGKKRAVRGASLRHPVGDAGNGEPTVRTLFSHPLVSLIAVGRVTHPSAEHE